MTSGSSMLAIIFTAAPQRLQIVISILNARLSRCAQVISLCSSAGDSRQSIGDDAYRGLEALAKCKHSVAIAYAEAAQPDSNSDYALAGYWLEIMSVLETGGESAAEALLPTLIKRDKKLSSPEQARVLVVEVMNDLEDVRADSGTSRTCEK